MEWFRLYHELLDDPKAQKLPAPLFKFWINLLCLASAQPVRGSLPDMETIAFRLRVSDEEAESNINTLIDREFIDRDETTKAICPHGWGKRQKKSDDVAERVATSRANKANADAVSCNGDVTLQETPMKHDVTVTPKEAEAEERQIRRESEERQSRAEQTCAPLPTEPQEASALPASAFLEQAPVPPPMPPEREKPPAERVITVRLEPGEWADLLASGPPGGHSWQRHEIWDGLEILSERGKGPRDAAALLHSKLLPEIRAGTKRPARLANAPPDSPTPSVPGISPESRAKVERDLAEQNARIQRATAARLAREAEQNGTRAN